MSKFAVYMDMVRNGTVKSLVVAGQPSRYDILERELPNAELVSFTEFGAASNDRVLYGPKGFFDFLKENKDKTVVLDAARLFSRTDGESLSMKNMLRAAIDGTPISYESVLGREQFVFNGQFVFLAPNYDVIAPSILHRSAKCQY
jgi:hypothetical protein